MCGRYFWNDDAEDEFLEDFPDLAGVVMRLRAGDYTPGMSAPALAATTGFRKRRPYGASFMGISGI